MVPTNYDEKGRKWYGFSASSRCGCLKQLNAPRGTLVLGSARGELKGGSLGEWCPGRGAVVVREEGRSVLGFRELTFSFHE